MIAKFKATTVGAIAFAKASSTASVVTKALAFSTGALTIALNALPLIGIATAVENKYALWLIRFLSLDKHY